MTAVNDLSRQFSVTSARVTRGVIVKGTLIRAQEANFLGEPSPDDPEILGIEPAYLVVPKPGN